MPFAVVDRGQRTRDRRGGGAVQCLFGRAGRQRAIGEAGSDLPEQCVAILGNDVVERQQRIAGTLGARRLGRAHGEAFGREIAADRIEPLRGRSLTLAGNADERGGEAMLLGTQQARSAASPERASRPARTKRSPSSPRARLYRARFPPPASAISAEPIASAISSPARARISSSIP